MNISHGYGVSAGARVVWISDSGPEFGTVKWIGHLSGHKNTIVGVEFDNPVGEGTGCYQGQRIFYAPLAHAAFVPLCGLLMASEYIKSFYEKTNDYNRNAVGSPISQLKRKPSVPLITTDVQNDSTSQAIVPVVTAVANDSIVDDSSKHNISLLHPKKKMSLGTCVETTIGGRRRYGVLRWIGREDDGSSSDSGMVAGLELEEAIEEDAEYECSDGTYKGVECFGCEPKHGVFIPLEGISPDKRFTGTDTQSDRPTNNHMSADLKFGPWDSGIVAHYVPPLHSKNFFLIFGPRRGIQGHKNSCYLDATIFAMFVASDAFDKSVLSHCSHELGNSQFYNSSVSLIKQTLSDSIVFPLRRYCYVRADHVMCLRELISNQLPHISGLTEEEKDPEEFINELFKLLRVPPLLTFSSKESAYMCQIVLDDDSTMVPLPTVQDLVEKSFFHSYIKLENVLKVWPKSPVVHIPQSFIVQLPRYGKQKIFDYIVPMLVLDLSHVIANNERACCMCGTVAEVECRECFLTNACSLALVTFCTDCFVRSHRSSDETMADHQPLILDVVSKSTTKANKLKEKLKAINIGHHLDSGTFSAFRDKLKTGFHMPGGSGTYHISTPFHPSLSRRKVPRLEYSLSAILCIETSHYVTFSRAGHNVNSRWCLFDSMADKEDNYCVPIVRECPNLAFWLTPEGYLHLQRLVSLGEFHTLPDYIKRLMSDGYIAFYQRMPSS